MGDISAMEAARVPKKSDEQKSKLGNEPSSYTVYFKKNLILVYFIGAFREDIGPVFENCLAEASKFPGTMMVIDLKRVPEIQETAVRTLRRFLHSIRHKNIEIRICDATPAADKTLNDHALFRPGELVGPLTDVVPTVVLRDMLR